jgi:hypothetical protein
MYKRMIDFIGSYGDIARNSKPAQPNDFTILIPVFEETSALEFSVHFFEQLGIRPHYVLDSKRRDRKSEVEKIVGYAVPVYQNDDGKTVEANFDRLISISPTDWIFRIDCDEVPNLEAITQCQQFIHSQSGTILGFARPQLFFEQSCLRAVSDRDYNSAIATTQWRLFNRNRVKIDRRIHTPGYKIPFWRKSVASLPASLFHLEWIFTTSKTRAEKSAKYEALRQASHMKELQLRNQQDLSSVPSNATGLERTLLEWFASSGREIPDQKRKAS